MPRVHALADTDRPTARSSGRASSGLLRKLIRWGLRLGAATVLAWGSLAGAQHAYEYATTSPRFETRGLVYEPTRHVDDDRVRELMALDTGTNILSLDLEAVARRIADDPWVARATVVRELPDTLIVAVEEHEPAAMLLAGYFYLVNKEGEAFKRVERGERAQLPVITGVERNMLLARSPEASARIQRGLEALTAYQSKKRPRLSEVHVGDAGEVTLYTAERGTQLRLGRGALEPRLQRLDALRAALREGADDLAVVHLDAASGSERKDRVVASFFASKEPQVMLAEAEPVAEPDREKGEQDRPENKKDKPRKRDFKKKKRIPRYE